MPISARLPNILKSTWLPCLLLGLSVSLLYGGFLWNPVVFDDVYFFDGLVHDRYLGKIFSLDLRWLPYATIEWTRALFGLDLIWFRLGNLALHFANVVLLFLFLRRLFSVVLPDGRANAGQTLSLSWLAFFGALIFALHPVSVYAAAYLNQRSILMATLFTLITWRLFLEGVIRGGRTWMLASAVAYFMAVLSKEHAIMAPAVAAAMLLLLHKPSREMFRQVWPVFLLYGLIGAYVIFQKKSGHVLGEAYQNNGPEMLRWLAMHNPGFDPGLAYPLSMLTQSFLFFKYLLLWVVPNPAWMSVDMYEPFALGFWSWPETAGLLGFILYAVVAVRLLLRRGKQGLLGFAMLGPWLMFATELSTVRIQEPFVLYRGYIWMGCAFALLPVLFGSIPARRALAVLLGASVLMLPLTWNRLTSFSHPLLLWDDAVSLVQDRPYMPGVERVYHNRGLAFYRVKMKKEALADYNKALELNPDYSYVYNDRGAIYLEGGRYQEALSDFNKSIALKADYARPYLGRGLVFEALHDPSAARADFRKGCELGMGASCDKARGMGD